MTAEIDPIIQWLETVREGLGPLCSEVVFVGGAIGSLLVTDKSLLRVRPTKDVDLIVKTTRVGYYKLEEKLRARGFRQKMIGTDPICRWYYQEIAVDFMPTDENILKFSNRWYEEAFRTAESIDLPSGAQIRRINAPLFLCTKLEAFDDRGGGKYEDSHDIEDVVAIVDGRRELHEEIAGSSDTVKSFLRRRFLELLENERFMGSIEWHLPYGSGGLERVETIERRMMSICRDSDKT